ANSKKFGVQSVGIGVLRESEINCCGTTIFADSQPRCTQFGERSALAFDLSRGGDDSRQTELPVGRSVLRSILIEGLDQIVHFGKKFIAFEDAPGGSVTACFEDGSKSTGDVLIGADGASSRLREQLLPHARRVETSIVAVSGKVGLNENVRRATPAPILRGPAMMLGPKGCFLFASAVDYPHAGGRTGDEPGASATAHDLLGHGRE